WEITRDIKERSEMLIWTIRYWEGVWIRRQIKEMESTKKKDSSSKLSFQRMLRSWSCLSPCFVSTIHSAARFFVPWQLGGPMYECIDLLIMDEAGQISMETALPLFPLAKKVVVAGDPEQIEPIWGIPEETDIGNLMKHGLLHHPDDFENFTQVHLAASNGNLQKRVDSLTLHPLWLTEQHRSHPQLVDFCNKLSYEDRLRAKRKIPEGALPPYAFAHISGEPKYFRGSWSNSREAEAIVDWIEANEKEWRQWYGMAPLSNILGVITPFTQQAALLHRLLVKRDIQVQVGTVHSFQGSEKPIILFSATQIVSEKTEPAFFDRKSNFMNVAVSRAKDSFWIVGNLNGWDPSNQMPSGLLSSYAMRNESSWLRNVWVPERTYPKFQKQEEIWIEDDHNEIFNRFQNEDGDIHLSMPFMRKEILENQGWVQFLKNIKKQNTVNIYMNKTIFSWYNSEEILDIQDEFLSEGFQLYWAEGLMDSLIWKGHSLLECSLPFLGMDSETQGRYYNGNQVPWLAKKIMEKWNLQISD
ncbi:MAG TPA: DEAD/DEAH box helicase, partial [Ignavibacteriaceae bacterium]